jgi:hypothetical protein
MKRLLSILVLLIAVSWPSLAADSWRVGFNFRATSGYVTDGADEIYVLGENNSTTRSTTNGNSATFIWSGAGPQPRDRTTGNDRRLAGINFVNGSTTETLTITLPQVGSYIVRLAIGDPADAGGHQYVQIRDNTTPLLTVDDATGPGANQFLDATVVVRTAAAWPSANVSTTIIFATTSCKVVVGSVSISDITRLAHLYLEYIPAATRSRATVIE